ncbi:MAG TPA: glutaredoxin family protein [Thermoleophilaceae bacterium]|nr:glutaredoxin family protein [Thermoleophilaceae bacterium]
MKLTFYGKAGCHLCEEAYAEVLAVQDEAGFELEVLDVSLDPRMNREYGQRVPVLAADGQDVLELGFDAASVRAVLGRVGP